MTQQRVRTPTDDYADYHMAATCPEHYTHNPSFQGANGNRDEINNNRLESNQKLALLHQQRHHTQATMDHP